VLIIIKVPNTEIIPFPNILPDVCVYVPEIVRTPKKVVEIEAIEKIAFVEIIRLLNTVELNPSIDNKLLVPIVTLFVKTVVPTVETTIIPVPIV
jgi:hypothetical protein